MNDTIIYAGDKAAMKDLTQFANLESFNSYYRRLRLTIDSELRPSWTKVLIELFRASAEMKGVTFFRRLKLAEKVGIGKTSLDDFLRFAKTRGFLRVIRAQSPKTGLKKRGGDAHLVFVFQPIEELIELPTEECRELLRGPSIGNCAGDENSCGSSPEVEKKDALTGFSFNKSSKTKKTNTYINKHVSNELPDIIQEVPTKNKSEIRSNQNLIEQYDAHPEKYASIAGVPTEIIDELKVGLRTTDIVSIWIGVRRTLSKYKANYSHYLDAVQKALGQAIGIYRAKKNTCEDDPFNWTALICGKLKNVIRQQLAEKLRKQFESAQNGKYDWISELSDEEKRTAQLIGSLSLIIPNVDELPY